MAAPCDFPAFSALLDRDHLTGRTSNPDPSDFGEKLETFIGHRRSVARDK